MLPGAERGVLVRDPDGTQANPYKARIRQFALGVYLSPALLCFLSPPWLLLVLA